ncbi:MAG: SusC/RagA family TonB-linked outer membrane protein, partial [Bacteroidota bacterium]
KGTQTNATGQFSIQAKTGDVLQFSYVGFQLFEQPVGSGSNYVIRLTSDQKKMGEVVITAHGIARNKATLGYSTPTVEGDEVTKTQRESFINGLAGRVPGLQVNGTSGQPGASAQIILRGVVSLDGDNSPLIV